MGAASVEPQSIDEGFRVDFGEFRCRGHKDCVIQYGLVTLREGLDVARHAGILSLTDVRYLFPRFEGSQISRFFVVFRQGNREKGVEKLVLNTLGVAERIYDLAQPGCQAFSVTRNICFIHSEFR